MGDNVLVRIPKASKAGEYVCAKFLLLYLGPYKIINIPHVPILAEENEISAGRYNLYNLIPAKY